MQKCDLCNKSAVVHEVTVRSGVRKEIHLCETHAREAGIVMPGAQPINQLLTQFVISQATKSATPKAVVKSWPGCGMSFAQFKQAGRLGCGQCYAAFDKELSQLIERAQSGGCSHCGKAPGRSGAALDQDMQVQRLTRELEQAVAAEQYERAAQLRDRLSSLQRGQDGGEGGSAAGGEGEGKTSGECAAGGASGGGLHIESSSRIAGKRAGEPTER